MQQQQGCGRDLKNFCAKNSYLQHQQGADMSSELFSVNRLAQLLERDRATIGRLVRDLPPDGRDRQKNPRWKLSTVVEAMSKQSGSTGSPRMLELADQLEATGAEVTAALERLRNLPTVAKRRKYAESGALTVIGRLNDLFEQCGGTLKPSERDLWSLAADVTTGEAISEIMSLCNFKIRPDEKPSDVVDKAICETTKNIKHS
jgi:hypothetical protein